MGFKVYRPAQTNVSVWLKNSLIAHHILFLVRFEYTCYSLGVNGNSYWSSMLLENELPTKFTLALTKYYGVNMSLRRNVDITMTVDEIQFKVCKVQKLYDKYSLNVVVLMVNNLVILHGIFIENQAFASKSQLQYVPESCCVLKDKYFEFNSFTELQLKSDVFLDREICVGYKSLSARDDIAPRIDNPGYITRSNAYLHEQGCVTVVKQDYRQYAIMLAASGTTALVLSIIGLIISFALLSHIEYQQFIRISTEYGSCNITTNTELSARDNISIISKQTSSSDILVKA
ncbi:unnamed protein product [Trichobilharzia regenti]|nr:unnamed protein product [Trichobilharzia regenti]